MWGRNQVIFLLCNIVGWAIGQPNYFSYEWMQMSNDFPQNSICIPDLVDAFAWWNRAGFAVNSALSCCACRAWQLQKGQWVTVCCCQAAKSLQSCPTLCDPRDGSPPGSTVPGILQARALEWGAIAFSVSHRTSGAIPIPSSWQSAELWGEWGWWFPVFPLPPPVPTLSQALILYPLKEYIKNFYLFSSGPL